VAFVLLHAWATWAVGGGWLPNKRLQLTARVGGVPSGQPAGLFAFYLPSAGPPADTRAVHGARQLSREPLGGTVATHLSTSRDETMITRIRVTGIRPGTLAEFNGVARDWKQLLEKHGGRVLGFYFNETENSVTGIAEYDSRARLSEIQRKCETDPAFGQIQSRAAQMITSFEERILDKLELDPE